MNRRIDLDTEEYWKRFTKGEAILRIPKDEALALLKEIDHLRARVAEAEAAGRLASAEWIERAERAEEEVRDLRDALIETTKKLTRKLVIVQPRATEESS